MTKKHTEERLEDAVVECLISQGGYVQTVSNEFDADRALNSDRVIRFIRDTQPTVIQGLENIHGAETEKQILDSLCKELELKGTLKVLREGFKCYGKKLKVVFFAPNNRMNPETLALYKRNELSVTRQLRYSNDHANELDIALFVNGLPVATAELKNPMTGQTVENAKTQYKVDRDHRELIFDFKKRALVHFAVDPNLVFMTTRISGNKTFFLPFNKGYEKGAGNPPAPEGCYRTSYLWEEVLQRDSLLDILGRFMHLQVEEKRISTDKGFKKVRKEMMIFPRYHQLDCVRKMIEHSRQHGSGRNYLVQFRRLMRIRSSLRARLRPARRSLLPRCRSFRSSRRRWHR